MEDRGWGMEKEKRAISAVFALEREREVSAKI